MALNHLNKPTAPATAAPAAAQKPAPGPASPAAAEFRDALGVAAQQGAAQAAGASAPQQSVGASALKSIVAPTAQTAVSPATTAPLATAGSPALSNPAAQGAGPAATAQTAPAGGIAAVAAALGTPSASPASTLKFSAHAVDRMRTRGISFSAQEMKSIEGAVAKAAGKGAKDTLVLSGDNALVVSVKNNVIVTVMDKAAMRENVFTNIDSTVVV